jgi:hypothetical protein
MSIKVFSLDPPISANWVDQAFTRGIAWGVPDCAQLGWKIFNSLNMYSLLLFSSAGRYYGRRHTV